MKTNAEWKTNLTFDDTEAFNTTFSDAETFSTAMNEVVQVVTSDHRELTNRDAENQHPIGAITSLSPELGARPSAALSNQDIQIILNA